MGFSQLSPICEARGLHCGWSGWDAARVLQSGTSVGPRTLGCISQETDRRSTLWTFLMCLPSALKDMNGEEGNAVCIFQISGLYVDLYKSLRKYEIPDKSQQDAKQCNAQLLGCLICFLFTLDVIGLCSAFNDVLGSPEFTSGASIGMQKPMAFYAFFCSDREEMDALLPWA